MEHICTRCARRLTISGRLTTSSRAPTARLLSTTTPRRAEDDSKPRHVDLSSIEASSASDESAYQAKKDGRSYKETARKIDYFHLPVSKVIAYDPADNKKPTRQNVQPTYYAGDGAPARPRSPQQERPQPSQRSASRLSGPPRGGTMLRRTGPPASRSSNPPQSTNVGPITTLFGRARGGEETPSNRRPFPSRGGQSTRGRARDGRFPRSPRREKDAEDEETTDDPNHPLADHNIQAAFSNAYDTLPTTNTTYAPTPLTPSDLAKTWPNTPLTPSGTVVSVTQRLGPLARRQEQAHWTPLQLADMYLNGEFVSFHSEAEKQETMKFVQQLKYERAQTSTNVGANPLLQTLSEKPTFSDLTTRPKETATVTEEMVKGAYPSLEKQKMGFMDSIVRHLRNNETYAANDVSKFMGRIEQMVRDVQRSGPQGQQQKKA